MQGERSDRDHSSIASTGVRISKQGREVARRRLRAQEIIEPTSPDPTVLVSRLVAVQSQDLAASKRAIGLRLSPLPGGSGPEQVDQALASGNLSRTHLLRWTWQIVSQDDVRWLQALVAPPLLARAGARLRDLAIDAGSDTEGA